MHSHNVRGGIRGIVELEVLCEIERYLGDKIPIQSFFDLIVGTRQVPHVDLISWTSTDYD